MSREFKRNEKKLNESEEKYRNLINNLNDIILEIKTNGNVTYVSPQCYNIMGYQPSELLGKNALNYIHPDNAKEIFKKFYDAFNKEGRGSGEARIRHKDGHYIYVEINGSLFHNERGEPKALLIFRDITERKRVENNILEEYKKLEELSQIKNDIIMHASHELKTPLSSIYMAAQILQKSYREKFDEKSKEFIDIIYKGSQKLRNLIDNLLDVSRIESGKLNLSLKLENVVKLILDCCTDLKYLADKKKIKLIFKLPEELMIDVDRIRLEQVFTNILSNAIKFTLHNGKIYITSNLERQWVDISIRDTGIGLKKKEIGFLFQKFGKIKRVFDNQNVAVEGSGLGLFISKQIAELHHGTILVKSDGRNKGSTFTIRLPLSK